MKAGTAPNSAPIRVGCPIAPPKLRKTVPFCGSATQRAATTEIMTKACASGQSSVIDRSIRATWPSGTSPFNLASAPPVSCIDGRPPVEMLQRTLSDWTGTVFLDVPDRWAAVAGWLASHGFAVQRPFLRMARGDAPRADQARMFVIAGPEFG